MKEAAFISQHKEKWKRMEHWQELHTEELAANFMELSDDLAYARTFYPGSEVVPYLNQLVAGYLAHISQNRLTSKRPWWTFWTVDYPLLLARESRTLIFAAVFFVFSMGIGIFSSAHDATFVRLILGDAYVTMTLDNIAGGKPMGVYAQGEPLEMFLRITVNNIRVAFVAFAFGLLFSAGTLWILFSNGIMLGAFQYFFFRQGLLLHSVFSVWAHGTFEITAIVLAGGAGLVMGNSFLFPSTYPRLQSFRSGALKGIKILTGLLPFFVVAGWIESFVTRYADASPWVGAVAIVLSLAGVVAYFIVYPYLLNLKQNAYGKAEFQ